MKTTRAIIVAIPLSVAVTLATAWIAPLIVHAGITVPGASPQTPPEWLGPSRSKLMGEPPWLAVDQHAAGVGYFGSFGAIEILKVLFITRKPEWDYFIASGWPFYAFHGGGMKDSAAAAPSDPRAPQVLLLPEWVPTRQKHRASVPVFPCWRGLSADLAIWWLVALALLWVPSATRLAIRRRQGRCLRCGYKLVGSGSCPECGGSVTA